MYISIFGKTIPSYGLLIAIGVILANVLAYIHLKKKQMDFLDFIILEAYCFLGAFIGAKTLYIIVSFKMIQWERLLEAVYFNSLMQGGFVFYGGMIGGLLITLLAGKIHKINARYYITQFIWLIPFIHSFGRVGCHKVGCCYGIEYRGIGSITYPMGFLAPANIPLFPVQLIEAFLLIVISFFLWIITIKGEAKYTVSIYFLSYGIIRFILEYFRGDSIRGAFVLLSTSQWVSIFLIAIGVVIFILNRNKTNLEE